MAVAGKVRADVRAGNSDVECTLDVLVPGQAARRRATVIWRSGTLLVDGEQLAIGKLYWVSRRSRLAVLFATQQTIAFFGSEQEILRLTWAIRPLLDLDCQRALLKPATLETVICAAATAVEGRIGNKRVAGLRLGVFTKRGVHFFERSSRKTVSWPARRTWVEEDGSSGRPQPILDLRTTEASIKLRYLFREEISQIVDAAERIPQKAVDALELFSEGEVAPLPADVPVFHTTSDSFLKLQKAAAKDVALDPSVGERFDRTYFENHFHRLGEIVVGPLMMRRSVALESPTLRLAVSRMDATQLRRDTAVAFQNAARYLLEVYSSEVEGFVTLKRLEEERKDRALPSGVSSSLSRTVKVSTEKMDPAFDRVANSQQELLQRLLDLDNAAPGTGRSEVEEATEIWNEDLKQLDAAYGAAWKDVLDKIVELWSKKFIPNLKDLASAPSPRRRRGSAALIVMLVFLVTLVLGVVANARGWLPDLPF